KPLADKVSAATFDKKYPEGQNTISLHFDIIDSGIGINSEQQEKIFDSFTQAENLQTEKFGGTGLGTTISKQLVELMGGTIGVNSTLGEGSHFWFKLSLPIEEQGNIEERYKQILAGKKVAIIVCKNALYDTLEHYCHYFGLSVERFYSESELLNGLQQSIHNTIPFDLILFSSSRDQHIPLKTVKKINELDYGSTPRPKKVFLCYLSTRPELQQLGDSLFDTYVTKPINFERLGDELLKLLTPENTLIEKAPCCPTDGPSLKILIAEDEDINAMVLSSLLQEAGHQTHRVFNGAQAVKELSQSPYDLAFMDMRMPEMNGLEAAIAWRKHESDGQHTPIVALTANATKDDRKACFEAGMDDFITKPIGPEQLASVIRKLCH
ncbi:MAG: response regulator, partial [Gammaproteobacteria bacterium]|nr:response regulator [Gammaproteobacteria bacterium]